MVEKELRTDQEKKPRVLVAAALIALVLVVVIVAVAAKSSPGTGEDYAEKYAALADVDLSAGISRENTYARYLERRRSAAPGTRDIPLDIFAWQAAEGVRETVVGGSRALLTDENSFVEYLVDVPAAGMYNLEIEYYPVESRGIAIERSLFINGETPFLGADVLSLDRVWGDGGPVTTDNRGNEIRPSQVEKPRWETARFEDSQGYFTEPYRFYFEAGENVLRLEGRSEPVAMRAFSLRAPTAAVSYREYLAGFNQSRYQNSDTGFVMKIQGENASARSDPSLYGIYDRGSGITDPPSAALIKLNMTGGQNWRVPGQWIEWEFSVPENGMYRISVDARQNYNRGYVSNRSVLIDGTIPCAEVEALPFRFSNDWALYTLQDAEGNDLLFPLSAGNHTIRLEVTLGGLGELLNTIEEVVYRMNAAYRKILVLTGTSPDQYRDYRLDFYYPDVIQTFKTEAMVLYKLADDLAAYSGERDSQVASILSFARQLEMFVSRPDRVPAQLSSLKDKISALGDMLTSLVDSQLDIDYIVVSAPGAELPVVKETFLTRAKQEIASLASSFMVDYNSLGDKYTAQDSAVEVWMTIGRDQSTILKSMIDDSFTPQTGIKINLKLVPSGTLMPAVVAGTGPDIVLGMGVSEPVNYAIRGAVQDLQDFAGFREVTGWFDSSALVPFTFDGKVYALPETQTFSIMFYRTDIFEELGIEPPETWTDVIDILPVIQKNNMNIGIPTTGGTTAGASASASGADPGFMIQLYQRGGSLYTEDGSRTMLDGEIAAEAFSAYMEFFTLYNAPKTYDFSNRFRTGEMPLGFTDFTLFNTLEVFAPEIRGLWDFGLVPGVKTAGGEINHAVPAAATATVMFANAKHKDAGWEFIKWWLSADSQLRYGRELESVMGASARYATANLEAFKRIAWSARAMEVLTAQREWAVGTPEVPGGYYVSRHIQNAVRRVLNESEDTRETLLDYSITINEELIKKRQEFGLE